MKLIYPAVFYPYDEGDGYTVVVPDLPGCISGGDTLDEAIEMGIDAASGWVLDEIEDQKPIPRASRIEDIHPDEDEPGGFVSLITLDMDAYAAKYGKKSVRKNLTIPAWLNTFAEQQKLNMSEVLRLALTDLYQRQRTA